MRAKQTDENNLMSTSDPHIDQNTGQPYDDEDANQLGYNDIVSTMGENLADIDANSSAYKTAKEANTQLYTDEEASDGGHYQNIIGEYDNPQEDENYTSVGVGAHGDIIAEDFTFKPVDQLSKNNSDNDSNNNQNDDSYNTNNNSESNNSNYSYSRPSNNYHHHGVYAYASGGAGGSAGVVHGGYAIGGSGGAGGAAVAVA